MGYLKCKEYRDRDQVHGALSPALQHGRAATCHGADVNWGSSRAPQGLQDTPVSHIKFLSQALQAPLRTRHLHGQRDVPLPCVGWGRRRCPSLGSMFRSPPPPPPPSKHCPQVARISRISLTLRLRVLRGLYFNGSGTASLLPVAVSLAQQDSLQFLTMTHITMTDS